PGLRGGAPSGRWAGRLMSRPGIVSGRNRRRRASGNGLAMPRAKAYSLRRIPVGNPLPAIGASFHHPCDGTHGERRLFRSPVSSQGHRGNSTTTPLTNASRPGTSLYFPESRSALAPARANAEKGGSPSLPYPPKRLPPPWKRPPPDTNRQERAGRPRRRRRPDAAPPADRGVSPARLRRLDRRQRSGGRRRLPGTSGRDRRRAARRAHARRRRPRDAGPAAADQPGAALLLHERPHRRVLRRL